MNALSVMPRIARLQYEAIRLPLSTLVAPTMARVFVDEAAGPRLVFDRALGNLDALAGRLIGQPTLRERGEAMIRRADALARAKGLEAAAAARRQQAAGERAAATHEAQQRRHDAHAEAAASAEAVRAEHRAGKVAAAKKAAAKARVATAAAKRAAETKVQAEARSLENRLRAVEQGAAVRSAAPKAQLREARAVAGDAAAQRRDADRLARLAEGEKARRTTN